MLAVALALLAAGPPASTAPSSALPYDKAVILIRSSLIAAQQANETGDYDVLQRLGTRSFQAANSPQKLAQTFAAVRNFNINSVLVLEPQFRELPHVSAGNGLGMAGYFVSDGYRIEFKLDYMPEAGRWRMQGIALGVQPIAKPAPAAR